MRSFYIDKATRAIADLDFSPSPDGAKRVCLNRINVPEAHRRKGVGTALLLRVLNDADNEVYTLYLAVSPDGSAGSLDINQLVRWYMKHGFVQETGKPLGFMVRWPRPHRCPHGRCKHEWCNDCEAEV